MSQPKNNPIFSASSEQSTSPPHVRPGHSGAGYFTLNVRHVVLAAVCVTALAIVTRTR
jgi:hypothetical protein